MKQILENAHSDPNPPAAPLYCVEFAQPTEENGTVDLKDWLPSVRREQCPRWSQSRTSRPDISNMALALRARLNAEMRHVALARARAPVKASCQGS